MYDVQPVRAKQGAVIAIQKASSKEELASATPKTNLRPTHVQLSSGPEHRVMEAQGTQLSGVGLGLTGLPLAVDLAGLAGFRAWGLGFRRAQGYNLRHPRNHFVTSILHAEASKSLNASPSSAPKP